MSPNATQRKLSDVTCFNVYSKQAVKMAELIEDNHVIQLSNSLLMDSRVIEYYGAVVAKNKEMVNNGEFVKLDNTTVSLGDIIIDLFYTNFLGEIFWNSTFLFQSN